ncbi:MAG TPA: lytic murein transglycosylase [Solirubrobacteraceae bacterium]|nr:lytic murein transglycosylase [Solirubrobacteraceae bacterium]
MPAATTPGGAPSAANPTFSFALPGPAPVGVPNFFIAAFQIPPFLLPIYQAAGIQYDVPWQILAAINEIETDYGRNLSVSSAGALGWMQFMPPTWKTWGVDANGDGVRDPYNPVDAIFAAARYLSAAGAAKNVSQAIFAYNHADWYVQSVLLRAKLISGMPGGLIGALTGLVEGHFPVADRARYADDNVQALATRRVNSGNAAIAIGSTKATSTSIYARQGAPVIAVNDGKIVKVGRSAKLGRFVQLQDQTGNTYTYAHLGSISRTYAVPKPTQASPAQLAKSLIMPVLGAPKQPASAGAQQASAPVSAKQASVNVKQAVSLKPATQATSSTATTQAVSQVKQRLFAYPSRPASYAAGGKVQLRSTQLQISDFRNYFSDVLHLAKDQYTLAPLRAGAIVLAGTILGRLSGPTGGKSPHMEFMIQPAGRGAPMVDPKPILDGWKLLEATAVYRASGIDPFFGPGAKDPSVGQILLMSKEQLQARILQDPHVQMSICERRAVQAGQADRRILAAIEFLSASGLNPTISGLTCATGSNPISDTSVNITRINGLPVAGHTATGSLADLAIRRMLTLQGGSKPDQIISATSLKGQPATLALPDHADRIQITYTPAFGANKQLSAQVATILKAGQWIDLINRISKIAEPSVPTTPSKYALPASVH